MALLVYLALINVLVRIGAAAVRKDREPKPEPMCSTCSFAHMQYAAGGKRAISCTFAGGVRPITIVLYRLPRPVHPAARGDCRLRARPARGRVRDVCDTGMTA